MRRIHPLALALLALAAETARGGDADPSPARRAADVRAAFPAPGAAAFRFEATIVVEGESRPRGTATFEARPLAGAAEPSWAVTETAEIHDAGPGGAARRQTTEAVLGRDLRLRTYERRVTRGDEFLEGTTAAWETGDRLKVVRVVPTGAERREKASSEPADRAATATLAGLVLFLRQCPAEPAAYEMPIFVHEAGAVRTVRIEVSGPSSSSAEPSAEALLTASTTMGDWTITLELTAKDRTLRRIAQRKGPTRVVFAPPPPLDASRAAATAREAGVRFLVGVLTGDEALVAGAFHWPTLLAAARAREGGFDGDEAALRRDVLGRLKATYQALPRVEAERRARAAADLATETEDEGGRRVEFGGPDPRLAYRAKAIDGAWYVVELLPGR